MLEYQSIFTRLIKYLLEGIAVAIAATLMSRRARWSYQEIAIVAVTASLTFFLLDSLAPSISWGARTGSGFGIGANMAGMPMVGAGQVGAGCQAAVNQVGGDAATEATGVDATTDAKALPSSYDYGSAGTPVTTMGPTVEVDENGIPITGNPVPGTNLSGTGAVLSSGCLIKQGACANGSPLFTQPINSCDCTLDCKPQCQPELQCPVSCPVGQRVFPNCNIASNNSPYKIVPGMFSHQVILPGYNECVKPYNYFDAPLGQN